MGYQFMHIEAFGRNGAHKKNSSARKPSMFDICAEMIRHPSACRHVVAPKQPEIVFGTSPCQAFAIANERAAQAVNQGGRKLRSDAPVVIVGVASWPVTVANLNTIPGQLELYLNWRRSTIEWIERLWGDGFKSAVEHLDEPHPHLHFVIVPELESNRRLQIASVHPGHQAAAKTRHDGGDASAQRRAYKVAMIALQDSYYECVGAKSGLTRIGPGRQRLNRPEWLKQQQQAEALAGQVARIQTTAASVEASARADVAKKKKETTEAAQAKIDAIRAQSVRDIMIVREKVTECVTGLRKRVKQLDRELSEKNAIIAEQAADLERLLSNNRPAPL